MADPKARRTGGRSARVRNAVLDATLQELREHGMEQVNIRRIAQRAEVHETSVYRRWRTREGLVLDALATYSDQSIPVPDTGTLHSDLSGLAANLATHLETPLGGALLRAMAAAGDDPESSQARSQLFRARYERAKPLVDRAVERGELPVGTDPRLPLEMLIAPLHFRSLFTRETLNDPDLPDLLAEMVINGLHRTEPRE